MSLPAPNLDDRSFQSIVDDVKRQIGLRCPEWTEHNVSDPGVTLLELFAYMTEMMLYRINQVPERNHIKFLELLGVTLETPEPARTDVRFRLTRPIPDTPEGAEFEMRIPARDTIASTVRTESEDAIEFATDSDLRLVQPKLTQIVAVNRNGDLEQFVGARPFATWQADYQQRLKSATSSQAEPPSDGFKAYSDTPQEGDSLYFGFDGEVAQNLVALEFDVLGAAATGLNELYPSQVWEVWSTESSSWERLETEDQTMGFNQDGRVEIAFPMRAMPHVLGGRRATWVRVRYTTDPADLPPRGIDKLTPAKYQRSPEIRAVRAATIGGTVSASNCTTVYREVLGVSDGLPGQIFNLRYSPVLQLRPDEHILIGALGDDPEDFSEWTPWTLVEDFADSGPDDRHFTIDYLTGEIAFGPNFAQPDGSGRTYGAIPEKGLSIAMSCYRHGGGTLGNIREGKIRNLKSPIPFVDEVMNLKSATGGRDRESLDRAKLRAREKLVTRDRAVTAEDFEFLAQKASSSVGRARCVQPTLLGGRGSRAGLVTVLLVPALSREIQIPQPSDLKVDEAVKIEVRKFLDQRRLLTSVLEVAEPDYRFVSIQIDLVADPRADELQVAQRVIDALNQYIHPLYGGPQGDGWPFRRSLTLADVYAQVGSVTGVAFLLNATMSVSELLSKDDGQFGPEVVVPNAEGIRLGENQLFATRQHRINVVPMSRVGGDMSGGS